MLIHTYTHTLTYKIFISPFHFNVISLHAFMFKSYQNIRDLNKELQLVDKTTSTGIAQSHDLTFLNVL